jgi:hypothetical protein
MPFIRPAERSDIAAAFDKIVLQLSNGCIIELSVRSAYFLYGGPAS